MANAFFQQPLKPCPFKNAFMRQARVSSFENVSHKLLCIRAWLLAVPQVDPKGIGLQPLGEFILQGLKPGHLTLLRSARLEVVP